jgi:hypothetical protein
MRVTLPHACFAYVVEGDRVVHAAPIARWTIGRDVGFVTSYYRLAKGAKVERVG